MYKKMSERRRAAFLKALEATGNVTLSAERACVSRSWVLLHRKEHPEFDAACRAAIGKARQSFDPSTSSGQAKLRTSGEGGRRPPGDWGHLEGVELVVRGSGGSGGGRRVQIARARAGQITARTEKRFLATLAATCNVKAAYQAAGISKGAIYTHRQRWPAFATRWDDALDTGYAKIQAALVDAACNLFSDLAPEGIEVDGPIPAMRFEDAMHLLHMHRKYLHGTGRGDGLIERRRKDQASVAALVKRMKALAWIGEEEPDAAPAFLPHDPPDSSQR
jgi:hypothetical protein